MMFCLRALTTSLVRRTWNMYYQQEACLTAKKKIVKATNERTVKDDPYQNKFVMRIGTEVAYITYTKRGDIYTLDHTHVPESQRGKSVGKDLAAQTFDLIKAKKGKIVLDCEYLNQFYKTNSSKYSGLVL